jgi:hypothetical protein
MNLGNFCFVFYKLTAARVCTSRHKGRGLIGRQRRTKQIAATRYLSSSWSMFAVTPNVLQNYFDGQNEFKDECKGETLIQGCGCCLNTWQLRVAQDLPRRRKKPVS